MRATSFLSGLFLTSVVLAAPTRKTDISDADPFHIGKRLNHGTYVPELPSAGEISQKLKETTEGAKLPARDLPVSGVTQSLSSVSVGDLTTTVEGVVSKVPVKVPSDLGDVESSLSPVTEPVTAAVTPFIALATELLNTVLASLTSADGKVRVMIDNAHDNASSIISTLQTDLASTLAQVEAANPTLQSEASGPTAEVTGLVSQVQVTANTLISDLESLEGSFPDVSSLVTTVKSIVSAVQATGL